jgi:hypothetical protein
LKIVEGIFFFKRWEINMKKEENAPKRKRGRPAKRKPEPEAQVFQPKPSVESPKPETKPDIKRDAPDSKCFVLCNGKPVKNVKELADVLDDLEDHVFNHHVRPDHNDFATWVKDIFNDVELAQKLADAKDKKHMQLVIYKHITKKLW